MQQIVDIIVNLKNNISGKLGKIMADFSALAKNISKIGEAFDDHVLAKVKELSRFLKNGGLEVTLVSDLRDQPIRLDLDIRAKEAVENFTRTGLDYVKKAILAPFEFLQRAIPERIRDEMSDVKAAGGIYSILMRTDPKIIETFRQAEELTRETNRYLAELAGSLPGSTEEYIAVAKQIQDGIVQVVSSDRENSIKLAQDIASEQGRSIDTSSDASAMRDTITQLTGEMTKLTVLAGLGSSAVGPYGLPMLVERMLSEEEVSLGFFQRYAAIFREPLIRTALERNIEEINKTGKDTAKRYEALRKTFEQIVTPELVRRYQRTISGSLEALRTAILSPEIGLVGLGRPLQFLSRQYDAFGRVMRDEAGNILQQNLSIFEFLRDIFFNVTWVVTPLIESVVSLYDPFHQLGLALDGIRISTMAFQDAYERYLSWLVEVQAESFGDQEKKNALIATAKLRASIATINSYLHAYGDITDREANTIGEYLADPDFTNFGGLMKVLIPIFLGGEWARDIGKQLGIVVGTILSTVAQIITGMSDAMGGSTLLAGFREGFEEAGGHGTIRTIVGSVFSIMFKGLWFILKEFFWEILFYGGIFLYLPGILGSVASKLVRSLVGFIQQGITGMLTKATSFAGLKKMVMNKGVMLKTMKATPFAGAVAGLVSFANSMMKGEGLGKALLGGLGAGIGAVKGGMLGAKLGLLAAPILGPLGPILGAAIFSVIGALGGEWIGKNIGKLASTVGKWIDKILNKMAEWLGGLFARIPDIISQALNKIREVFSKIGDFITNEGGVADKFFADFKAGFDDLAAKVKTAISDFFQRLKDSFTKGFTDAQPDLPPSPGDGRQDWGPSTPLSQQLLNTGGVIYQTLVKWFAFLAGFIVGGIANFYFKVIPTVGQFILGLGPKITTFFWRMITNIISWFMNPETRSSLDWSIGDFLTDALESIKNAIGTLLQGAKDAFWEGVKRGWSPLGAEPNTNEQDDRPWWKIWGQPEPSTQPYGPPIPNAGNAYKGSGTDSFMPLPRAIATELKNKPPGSDLVIANSSELIIPTQSAAKGNGDVAAIVNPLHSISSHTLRTGTNTGNALNYLNQLVSKVNETRSEISSLSRLNSSGFNSLSSTLYGVASILQSGLRVEVTNSPTVKMSFEMGEMGGPIGGAIGNFPKTSGFGQRWGRNHDGNDYAMPVGTRLALGIPGRVVGAGYWGGYGLAMDLMGPNGVVYRFAHLSRFLAPVGATVPPNMPFALSGNTGRSTGPHLHFEARPGGGSPVNPDPFASVIKANFAGMDVDQVMGGPVGQELSRMPYGSDLVVGNSSEIMMKPNQTANLISSSVRAGVESSGSVTISGMTININGSEKSGKELANEIAAHILEAIETANYSGVY